MDGKQLVFRKQLFRLGEKLSSQDLEYLCFLCKGTIRASRLEKCRSATELFQALSEHGKLSADDLSYLAQILTSIGKENLLSELRAASFSFSETAHCVDRNYKLQECLVKIAQELTSIEVEKVAFIVNSSIGLNLDKIFSATQLFQILQQRQVITGTELRPLFDALVEIGRKDLASHINAYLQFANISGYTSVVNNGEFCSCVATTTLIIKLFIGVANMNHERCEFPPPVINASTPSSGVASYVQQQSCVTDNITDSSPGILARGSCFPAVPLDQKTILPFGLEFDVFEEEALSSEGKLLHSLSVKEGELRSKENELERLERELSEQIQIGEIMVQQRAEDRDVYSKSIQDLQSVLIVKNQEVTGLVQELQVYHQQMAALQASSPIREDDLYKMDRQPHGVCLIFNNHQFHHPYDKEKAHPTRGGALIDQYNLLQTFKYLRYDVIVKENLTAQEMQDTMFDMAKRDHHFHDSFVCCILTHGETNVVHGADSQQVDLLDFAATMKLCPSLREKPKLFFIQACRGEGEHKGLELEKDSGGATQKPPAITATIPQEADFFFGYATPTGNAAYRSRRHGSWYISELCKVLTQHAYTHNLSSMMKKVNNQVAKAYTKEGYKQCPEFVDRLRREVHFFHFLKGQF